MGMRIELEFDAVIDSDLDDSDRNREDLRWALIRALEGTTLTDLEGRVLGVVDQAAAR